MQFIVLIQEGKLLPGTNQTRGINIRTENLLTTRGAQMAIYVAAALLIQPGDKVIVSEPSYFFANMIFESLGAQLIRIPVDDHGMCTDMVEEALRKHTAKLIYVIPHHHHPTTVTMSVERRNHLLRLNLQSHSKQTNQINYMLFD